MSRYVLGIEYDGRTFSGWQSQVGRSTIQGTLEEAVGRVAGHPVRIHAAGRTDAGVHAICQIAHFDTEASRPLTAWVRAVNSFLPSSIAVLWAKVLPISFHARSTAIARHYRYILLSHPVRPALWAGRVGWVHVPLDINAMRRAAKLLIGTHDFSSFRASECQSRTPIKTLMQLDISQEEQVVTCHFSADAFLHHMVRNIMGCLVHIAKGKMCPEWVLDVLAARNRCVAPPTFMPDGLYLAGVSYPKSYSLPAID